jgi:hypothetical protein
MGIPAPFFKIIERLEAQHQEILQHLSEIDPALAQKKMNEAAGPNKE